MKLAGFDELFAQADALTRPVGVVAAGGADPTVLEAMQAAQRRGWIEPVVTGDASEIREVARTTGAGLDQFRIIDSATPATAAVSEIRAGRAAILMKGQLSTPDLLKAVLNPEAGLRTGTTICQVVLMELPDRDRRFILADTGICIDPTIDQRVEIMNSAVSVAHSLQAPKPNVALVTASEKPTDKMPETVEALEITQRMADTSGDQNRTWCELADCVVQGPLSFDLAIDNDSATKKRIPGPVVGKADILVFPNLVSANLTVKAIMYTANCRFGGVLCGATCPVVFMSRGDTAETRLRSMSLAIAHHIHSALHQSMPSPQL